MKVITYNFSEKRCKLVTHIIVGMDASLNKRM